ncbi:MAG: hypothetical protein ACJAZO_000500 [Myxococcota bacterium]
MRFYIGLILLMGCDDSLFVPQQTFGSDWAGTLEMLSVQCADCHPSGSQVLPEDDLRADRVSMPDVVITDVCEDLGNYVVPGDLSESQLWRIVTGMRRDSDPPRMPSGRSRLTDSQVADLEEWILNGAAADCN